MATILDDEIIQAAQQTQDERDALQIIQEALAQYGLAELAPEAVRYLIEGVSADGIMIQLRETETFKERFKGLDIRNSKPGMIQISPAEYIRIERQYRDIMATAGLPQGFYDSPDDFAQFIGNDVSPDEVAQRVSMAASAVSNINPLLKDQLNEMYGIGVENDGELIAYFLDPERGVSVIEQRLRIESAGLSASAIQATGQGIDAPVGRQLVADQNVQQREISQRLAPIAGLTQATLSDEGVTTTELAASSFGLDSEATANIRRLRQRRQASAERRSGGLMTSTGAVGLGSAPGQLDS